MAATPGPELHAADALQAQQAQTLLVVLLGLPGAGKTTLAASLCDIAATHDVRAHHVCLDAMLADHAAGAAAQASQAPAAEVAPAAQDDAGSHVGPSQQQLSSRQQLGSFSPGVWQACRQQLVLQVKELLQLSQQPQHQQRCHDNMQDKQSCQQATRDATAAGPISIQQEVSLQQAEGQQPCQQLLLVDDNNFYNSMRYEFLRLARSYSAAFLQLYLDCPLELALARNRSRNGSACIPNAVLRRCADVFEAPAPDRHPWEVGRTLVLKPSDVPAVLHGAAEDFCEPYAGSSAEGDVAAARNRLWELLIRHWGPPVPPVPDAAELEAVRAAATAVNLASRVHQADLASRALLNATLEHVHAAFKADIAKVLNTERKHLLQHLRQQMATGSAAEHNGVVEELTQAFHQMCMQTVVVHHPSVAPQ